MSIDLSREKDPEILRQAALLLEAENKRLVAEVMELTRRLLEAEGKERVALQLEIQALQAQLAKRNKALFGQSSEQREGDTPAEPKAPRKPKTGHGPTKQQNLRIVEENIELSVDERICILCRGSLEEMGEVETSEEVDVVAREFVMKRYVRKKYRCRCGECIETAPLPPRLIPGGRYSLAFAVNVALSKYADHLPLERQVKIMRREGLEVSSQTLYDQIEALAKLLWPAYDRLGVTLLEEPLLHVDETPWLVFGQKQSASKWYAWTITSTKGAYYEIHDTRGKPAGKYVLLGYAGKVVTDGYAVYQSLAKEFPGLVLVQCWAHIRRKFVDCESAFPKESKEILALIRELYEIDTRAAAGREGDALRAQLRTTESRVVLARIQAWCVAVHCTPGSTLASAIEYMTNHWSNASRFLDDPTVPLDNNAAERALRGLVIGRKNHYGSRSRRGTEVAAVFYTLVETAKLLGTEAGDYLRRAAEAALAGAEPLLPHEIAARA